MERIAGSMPVLSLLNTSITKYQWLDKMCRCCCCFIHFYAFSSTAVRNTQVHIKMFPSLSTNWSPLTDILMKYIFMTKAGGGEEYIPWKENEQWKGIVELVIQCRVGSIASKTLQTTNTVNNEMFAQKPKLIIGWAFRKRNHEKKPIHKNVEKNVPIFCSIQWSVVVKRLEMGPNKMSSTMNTK